MARVLGHTINLIVRAGTDNVPKVGSIISKAKTIVKFIRISFMQIVVETAQTNKGVFGSIQKAFVGSKMSWTLSFHHFWPRLLIVNCR